MTNNKEKENNYNEENHKFFYDPNNEISINDLIWEIDNSKDFKLFEIDENEEQNEKKFLIKIYKN